VLSAVPISYADFSQTETKTSKKIRVFAGVTLWGQRFGSGHLITWTVFFFVLGREWCMGVGSHLNVVFLKGKGWKYLFCKFTTWG